MKINNLKRRDFIKTILAGLPVLSLDWDSFPRGQEENNKQEWDAVVIGAGLGGLSCAAAFARQGFKPLVLEQHYVPGGYATTFKRPGGFVFDVSLHSTTVGERGGVHNLIPGFPEIKDIEFVPHHNLYRAIFPEHDIRVPQKDVDRYIKTLMEYFPEEKEGIAGLFKDMKGLRDDIGRYSQAGDQVSMANFPREFPYIMKVFNKTWGQLLDLHIKNTKLRGIISGLWGYYGLPPSKLACIYYAMPTIGYLEEGGYYPIGKSQKISDAFMEFIEERGGKILLRSQVEKILVKDHTAYGVMTDDGKEYLGKVVVSNANAIDTFHKMMDEKEFLEKYLAKMDTYSTSLSSFQVFLGLKTDLIKKTGIEDTEIFYTKGYDMEEEYTASLNADVEKTGFGLTVYDLSLIHI